MGDSAIAGQTRRPAAALLTQGFRPFFLAAGLWAVVALGLWVAIFAGGASLPSRFDPLSWHIHEMLFGFVMAAVAGFLLTAIPNWTRRPPVGAGRLALLAGLWLVGRLVCMVSILVPIWLALVLDLAFPAALVATIAREIVAGRNWRNLPMVAPVIVLGIANLLMHLEADGAAVPTALGWRLGLAGVSILISVVAGRIIPSFTRNWLAKRGAVDLPGHHGAIDRIALGSLHAGLLGWVIVPTSRGLGLALLLSAALNFWRLLRWRGAATTEEPLLFVLHVGYAWLIAAAALLGLRMLAVAVPQSAAVHALTVGAIGTMILAVMTRVTRGHTGRALSADRSTSVIYLLVSLAAIGRVAAAFGGTLTLSLLTASACSWIGAFGLFVLRYGPFLVRRRDLP